MPENPWGRQDDGETRQWAPVTPPDHAGQRPVTGPERSGGGGGLAVAVTAAVLAVLLLLGVIWWFFLRGGDTGHTATSSSPRFTGIHTTTETVAPAPQSEPAPTTSDPAPTVAPTNSGSPSTSTDGRPGTGTSFPSGLTSSGWTGPADASCNGSDTWVYAGGNGSTKVVVCRVGAEGDLYYRGYAGGQGLERDVDMASVDLADGYFEIPADPATIVIDGDRMTLSEGGRVVKTHYFDVARVR